MTETSETTRSSASSVASDAQPDLLAARRAAWEAGAIKPNECRPRRPASDDDLTARQAEATERALRNWDKDELEEISGPQGGSSLGNALGVAIADLADDFGGKRLTPWIDYLEYLQSDRWRELRRRKLLRCGGICQRCNRSWRDFGFLDVHHLDYRRFGAEREADLIVLCRECHNAEHGVVR
jgi:hypothetical protein